MKWPSWLRWLQRKPKFEHGPPLASALMLHGLYADGSQTMAGALPGGALTESASAELFAHARIVVERQLELDLENIGDQSVRFQGAAFFIVDGTASTVLPFGPVIIEPHSRTKVGGRVTERGLLRRILIPTYQAKVTGQ